MKCEEAGEKENQNLYNDLLVKIDYQRYSTGVLYSKFFLHFIYVTLRIEKKKKKKKRKFHKNSLRGEYFYISIYHNYYLIK